MAMAMNLPGSRLHANGLAQTKGFPYNAAQAQFFTSEPPMTNLSYAARRNEIAAPALPQLLKELFRATPLYLFIQAFKGR
jgi:hypothetical protein